MPHKATIPVQPAPPTTVSPTTDEQNSNSKSNVDWMRIRHMAETERYKEIIDRLHTGPTSPMVQNARAVCLMRLGRGDDAAQILRQLVMPAGCTWMRPDAPLIYKLNFATSLLLRGLPSGCLSTLREIHEPTHPTSIALQAAVQRWVKSLSPWSRFLWTIGGVEPDGCRVPIDFVPGLFDWDTRLA